LKYNFYHQTSNNELVGSINIYQAGSINGTNNFVVDPFFNDASNDDFSLSSSSQEIGLDDNAFCNSH